MKKGGLFLSVFTAMMLFTTATPAHFGMVIPSDSMVMQEDERTVHLQLSFSHPFEMIGMTLEKPKYFGVIANGKKEDLKGILKPDEAMGQMAWQADYGVKRPGVYMFTMEPVPYWEPAEDIFIIHYTKTVMTAFGDDEGWDGEAGLKTEIVPLSKPYGLYTGNVFQGIVKLDGKPMPYAQIEVEYYNSDRKAEAPTGYMVAQTLKADGSGVFTYAAPRSGWWGFAALSEADFTLEKDGEKKQVEIGAVIWVHFEQWREK